MIVRDQQEAPLTIMETTPFLPGLSPVSGKTITATFDGGTLSSNGGVVILHELKRGSVSPRCSAGTFQTIAMAGVWIERGT